LHVSEKKVDELVEDIVSDSKFNQSIQSKFIIMMYPNPTDDEEIRE